MANTVRPKRNTTKAGKAAAVMGILAMLTQFVTPEMMDRIAQWMRQQHFSERFIKLIEQIHMPKRKSPLEKIKIQCEAIDELIATRSAELSDDAPITQWRMELDRIRRGMELMNNASVKDRRKIKDLQQRTKKLFDSAFAAAIE